MPIYNFIKFFYKLNFQIILKFKYSLITILKYLNFKDMSIFTLKLIFNRLLIKN
jgi:hypothetical protein